MAPQTQISDPAPRPAGRGRVWQLALAALFSIVSLALALRDVDWPKLTATLQQVRLGWVTAGVLSVCLTLWLKSERWRALLAVRRAPGRRAAFSAQSIGMLLNAFAPARLGDVARAYVLGQAEAESKAFVFGTIVVEKLVDLACLALILLWLLARMPLPAWLPARQTAVVVGVALVALAVLDRQHEGVLRLARWAGRLAPTRLAGWFQHQLRMGLDSLSIIRSPRRLAQLAGWSLVIWIVSALTNWLIWRALNLNLPLTAAWLLLVVLQVGGAAPSSPGRIGVFHYLTIISLALFNVEKETALGYAVILHLAIYGPLAILGAWFVWRERLTWRVLQDLGARFDQLAGRGE